MLEGSTQAIRRRKRTEDAIANGERPRFICAVSFLCLIDPMEHYTGSYLLRGQFHISLGMGNLPPGSLWLNDHERRVYEVVGQEGLPQESKRIGKVRLRALKKIHHRLNVTLCRQKVY